MSARFRIRTSQGQELSFATHEMFSEFVRSGDLSPDDVVYDAETREWAPARTHPLVLQIETEADEGAREHADDAAEEVVEGISEEAVGAGAEASDGPDLGLELAPAPEQPSQEQAEAAFAARMEAERATDLDFDDEPALQGFLVEQGSSGIVEEIVERAPSLPPSPRREPPPRREPLARAEPRKEKKKKKKKRGSGRLRKYAPFLIVGSVVAGVGVYFGPELLAPTSGEGTEAGPDAEVVTPPPPPPLIPATEEALGERAQERFLNTTRILLRDLVPIPQVWLTGLYLSAPSDYPEVREVWSSYLTTIREVRVGDDDRYRTGYETALDDARVEGEARAVRLAGATEGFLATMDARVAHYDRVEAMATAAIQGHDALVEAEGTIAYEPVIGGRGVSGDPVIEAVGRNAGAQALLDQVLDLVLGELHGAGGPGEIANVQTWVYDGLLDAVTN